MTKERVHLFIHFLAKMKKFYIQFIVLTFFSGHSDQPFSLQHARGGNYFHSQNPLGLYLLLIDCTFSKVGLC